MFKNNLVSRTVGKKKNETSHIEQSKRRNLIMANKISLLSSINKEKEEKAFRNNFYDSATF